MAHVCKDVPHVCPDIALSALPVALEEAQRDLSLVTSIVTQFIFVDVFKHLCLFYSCEVRPTVGALCGTCFGPEGVPIYPVIVFICPILAEYGQRCTFLAWISPFLPIPRVSACMYLIALCARCLPYLPTFASFVHLDAH